MLKLTRPHEIVCVKIRPPRELFVDIYFNSKINSLVIDSDNDITFLVDFNMYSCKIPIDPFYNKTPGTGCVMNAPETQLIDHIEILYISKVNEIQKYYLLNADIRYDEKEKTWICVNRTDKCVEM